MKKNVIIGFLSLLLVSGCDTTRESLSSVDDVYAIPSEVRASEKAATEKARQEELAQAEAAKRTLPQAQEPVEDPKYKSPKYQDPNYSADDYYDYAYSSRLNRFYHPMGLGYYDSYYTNMYTYTGNPMLYGSSIYAGSLYNMSVGTYNGWHISVGTSYGYGYGSGYGGAYGFGNYGYMNPYYDPWMAPYANPYSAWPYYGGAYGYGYGSPYMSYWNGYNSGYNAGYSNGQWGYYNSCDANSAYSKMLNAPRESHGGGARNPTTGQRTAGNAVNNQRTYLDEVAAQQQNRQRFTAAPNDRVMNRSRNESSGTQRQGNQPTIQGPDNRNTPVQENNNRRGAEQRNQGRILQNQEPQTQPQRRESPVIQPGNSGGGNEGRRGSDGGSSPRNSGGGRPR